MIHILKNVDNPLARHYLQRISQAFYEPGSLVLDFDDSSSDVFFIDSGSVRLIVRNAVGREIILGDLHKGDIFGEMAAIDDAARSAHITALHRSTVSRMNGPVFREMATGIPEVALFVMKVLINRIRIGNQRMLELATLQLKHRLYAELLREARQRSGSDELVISPPPMQQVLAGRIGGRREAVSLEIADMIRKGLVKRTPTALVICRPELIRAELTALLGAL